MKILKERINKENMEELLYNVEQPLTDVLASMEFMKVLKLIKKS